MNSNILTISTNQQSKQHLQPHQIYIPPDRCHTREREYARPQRTLFNGNETTQMAAKPMVMNGNDQNTNEQSIFPLANGHHPSLMFNQNYKFINSYDNDDNDFWEDLTVNHLNVSRRISAVGGVHGPNVPVSNAPVVGKKQMFRDVAMKLRENVENLSDIKRPNEQQKELSIMAIKGSRLTSAASSRVVPIKIGDSQQELGCQKGNDVECYGLWAKLMAEFSGDLFLVLISSLSAISSDPINGRIHAGLATGLVIFVLIASVGQISGGHFNPAVTFAIALNGKMPIHQMLFYWIAQLGGGFVGSLLIWLILQSADFELIAGGATILAKNQLWYQGLAVETILTALLVQTILNGAIETPNNQLAPLAIGCTILVDIIGAGPLSGASMNPARSFGPCLVASLFSTKLTESEIWSRHFVYWAGPFLGATISALAFRYIFTRNQQKS